MVCKFIIVDNKIWRDYRVMTYLALIFVDKYR